MAFDVGESLGSKILDGGVQGIVHVSNQPPVIVGFSKTKELGWFGDFPQFLV